jgi:hypothetical protein
MHSTGILVLALGLAVALADGEKQTKIFVLSFSRIQSDVPMQIRMWAMFEKTI